ncbi:hypothetical protein ACLB1R_01575 [Escherichia coli]
MKWDNVYVLTFQSDDDFIMENCFFFLCLRYDIPLERIAVFKKKHTEKEQKVSLDIDITE